MNLPGFPYRAVVGAVVAAAAIFTAATATAQSCRNVERGTGAGCISDSGPQIVSETRTFGKMQKWVFTNSCTRGIDVHIITAKKNGLQSDVPLFVPPGKKAAAECNQAAGCDVFLGSYEVCPDGPEGKDPNPPRKPPGNGGGGDDAGGGPGDTVNTPPKVDAPGAAGGPSTELQRLIEEQRRKNGGSSDATLNRLRDDSSSQTYDIERTLQEKAEEERRRQEAYEEWLRMKAEAEAAAEAAAAAQASQGAGGFDLSRCSHVERDNPNGQPQVLCFRSDYQGNNPNPGATCDASGPIINGVLYLNCDGR